MDGFDADVELAGQQVIHNIVDNQMLIDAHVHPELYVDLWARPGGYSARFVDLSS